MFAKYAGQHVAKVKGDSCSRMQHLELGTGGNKSFHAHLILHGVTFQAVSDLTRFVQITTDTTDTKTKGSI